MIALPRCKDLEIKMLTNAPTASAALVTQTESTYNFAYCPLPTHTNSSQKYIQSQDDALARVIHEMRMRAECLPYGLGVGIYNAYNSSRVQYNEKQKASYAENAKIKSDKQSNDTCALNKLDGLVEEICPLPSQDDAVASQTKQTDDTCALIAQFDDDFSSQVEEICPLSPQSDTVVEEEEIEELCEEDDSDTSSYFDYISSIMDYLVDSVKEFTRISLQKVHDLYETIQTSFQNAEQPVQSATIDNLTCAPKENTPQALMLRAKPPAIERIFNDGILGVSRQREKLLTKLSTFYQVHSNEVDNIRQFCQAIERASLSGPIKLLVIEAHGTASTLRLGSETINVEDFFNGQQDLSCLTLMAPNVKVVLASCDTAHDHQHVFENGDVISFNTQKLFAHYLPSGTVYAADFTVLKGSLDIALQPTFKIHAYGTDITHAMSRIFEWRQFIENMKKINSAYVKIPLYYLGNKAPARREMIEISPQNGTLVHDSLSYFKMKKNDGNPSLKNFKPLKEFSSARKLGPV